MKHITEPLTKKNITDILVEYTNAFIKDMPVRSNAEINNGHCFVWADLITRILPEAKMCGPSHGHVWIEINHVFYDSQHVSGSKNIWGFGLDEVSRNEEALRSYWHRYGKEDGLISWNDEMLCHRVLKDTLERLNVIGIKLSE